MSKVVFLKISTIPYLFIISLFLFLDSNPWRRNLQSELTTKLTTRPELYLVECSGRKGGSRLASKL